MNVEELEIIQRTEEESSNGKRVVTYYKCPCTKGQVVEILENGLRSFIIECDTCKYSYDDMNYYR